MKYAAAILFLLTPMLAWAQDESDPLRVGMLAYAQGKSGVCFADDFLNLAAREMQMPIHRAFDVVRLDSDELFTYPFVVLSGEGAFDLSEAERDNLKSYLDGGGFLLASAGCSNIPWARSFEAIVSELYPERTWQTLEMDHPLFHTVYDIETIEVKKEDDRPHELLALANGERLSVVYAKLGLNDTSRAGDGCCCCGGNEIRNARTINVNILAYALTH